MAVKELHKTSGHRLLQISDRLFQLVFRYPASTNCWLWLEPDGITLVDAGHPWNTQAILNAVRLVNEPLKRIAITHAHPDHAGAASALLQQTGARVYAHEIEVPYLQGNGCMADDKGFWLCRCVLGTGRAMAILQPPVVPEAKAVAEGDYIGSLKVLHTPGHTPGSASFWVDEIRAIFCGDNVCYSRGGLHIGLPWFTLDRTLQKQSIARYMELKPNLLLSGHGRVYGGDVADRISGLIR